MERLPEGFSFREIVLLGKELYAKFSIANGDVPEQQFLIAYLPFELCLNNWDKITQFRFSGNDLDGKGYAVNMKRIIGDVPVMTAEVVKYSLPYQEAIFNELTNLVEKKDTGTISWIVPVDVHFIRASWERSLKEIRDDVFFAVARFVADSEHLNLDVGDDFED